MTRILIAAVGCVIVLGACAGPSEVVSSRHLISPVFVGLPDLP